MKNIIKIELRRAFINRAFFVALAIGMGISLWHVIFDVIPGSAILPKLLEKILSSPEGGYPHSLYNKWLGANLTPNSTIAVNLYFFILPLLVCIPYVGSFHSDRKGGYAAHVMTRVKGSHYYLAKLLAIFLSAASVAVIPLLFNFIATAMFFPAIIPENTTFTFPISHLNMWAEMYYSTPLLYTMLFFVLIAITSGLLALFGAAISYFVDYVVFSLLTPFALCSFSSLVLGPFGVRQFTPTIFMRPDQPMNIEPLTIMTALAVIIIALTAVFFFKLKKDELY